MDYKGYQIINQYQVGDQYVFKARVGGGGGHALVIRSIQIKVSGCSSNDDDWAYSVEKLNIDEDNIASIPSYYETK